MKNGLIRIDDMNFIISPELTEDTFLESNMGKNARLIIDNLEYHTYQCGNQKVGGNLFTFLVVFLSRNILSVSMDFVNSNPKIDKKYEDKFTLSDLLNVKIENDRWLFSILGGPPPYRFPWGRIESTYDKRSWSASLLVRYKRKGVTS